MSWFWRLIRAPWTITATGHISDMQGYPIYYALASFSGLNVRTNQNGAYTIKLEPEKTYNVAFSSPDYVTQTGLISTVGLASDASVRIPDVFLERLQTSPPVTPSTNPERGEPAIPTEPPSPIYVPEVPIISPENIIPDIPTPLVVPSETTTTFIPTTSAGFKALMVRPNFEIATRYMAYWLTEVQTEVEAAGVVVTTLDGDQAIPGALEAELQKGYDFVFMGGHGAEDILGGDMNQVVLKACTNDGLLRGSNVVLVSCRTAVKLGPSMISKGVKGYDGWNQDIVWIIGENGDPATEIWHIPTMNVVHKIILTMIAETQAGNPKAALVAAQAGIDQYDKEISEWSMKSDPLAVEVVSWLIQGKYSLLGMTEGQFVQAPSPLLILGPIIAGAGLLWWLSTRKGDKEENVEAQP